MLYSQQGAIMCGRFDIHSAIEIIARLFGISTWDLDYPPNYNITPGQDVLMIMAGDGGKRRLMTSRWGFVPSWSKDLASGYKMINARAETLSEKPSFKAAFRKHRCLIIADGFFEWKKEGTAKKPYYIRLRSGQPFGFAGLYNVWHSPEGEDILTSTIITTDANELVRSIHDRMPVITDPAIYDAWLDPSQQDPAKLASLIKPVPARDMECYPVSARVNSPKNNDPSNIQPVRA